MLPSHAHAAAKPNARETEEMPRMALALGIEPALLLADHPALFAGLQQVCAQCGSKDSCRKDLAAEQAVAGMDAYCGNASTLRALQERPELARD